MADLFGAPGREPPPSIAAMSNEAVFSPCKAYRYYLKRVWDASKPLGAFIMLNPSTATETVNDPTVRRCVGYLWDWGYGGMIVGNAFALRSTDPEGLKKVSDPVGPDNDAWIISIAREAELVVCGWGNHGLLWGRGAMVLKTIRAAGAKPHALAVTGRGQPGHPLYLAADLKPFPLELS